MRQSPQRELSRRWTLQPPLLLAPAFAVFAFAAVRAQAPFTATRVGGAAVLISLGTLSLFCGARKSAALVSHQCGAGVSDAAHSRACASHAEVVSIQRADLTNNAALLTSPRNDGQFKVALTLGCVAVAALVVVVCLLAGQMQRSGRITAFGLLLGLLLVMPPAILSLHVALSRVQVQINPDGVYVTLRRGLFGNTHLQWMREELQAIELSCPEAGCPVDLVIQSHTRTSSIRIAGLSMTQMMRCFLRELPPNSGSSSTT